MEPILSDRLRVVLVATRNPLNIGAVARAMSNFGFSRLRVVTPFEVAFREARSAVGAAPLIKNAEEYATLAEAVADCSLVVGTTAVGKRQLTHPVKSLDECGDAIRAHLAGGSVALLFGSEKRGLSRNDLSHCHWLLRIPTLDEHRSMNLGQAVAVCLYELARSRQRAPESPATATAKADELERLTLAFYEALIQSGYIKRGSEAHSLEKARRLIRRMSLTSADAETWTGALAKINLALRRRL